MHHLGNFSLMAILVVASYAVIAALLSVQWKNAKLLWSAERALLACVGLSTAACVW